jgi:hypothetical protein
MPFFQDSLALCKPLFGVSLGSGPEPRGKLWFVKAHGCASRHTNQTSRIK